MRGAWVVGWSLVSGCLLGSCLVQGRSYRSSGDETRKCTGDEDCPLDQQCRQGRCAPAPGCAACGDVDHGLATCVHGVCLLEVCEPGWYDADGVVQDGCEYQCAPTGPEACNGRDDDCDGLVDEDFDLDRDPENCGACGNECPSASHARPICAAGSCRLVCEPGWYDVDGDAENGCESRECVPTGEEVCDLRDNDCDGKVDEGIPKDQVDSCGPLCERCTFDHATPACQDGHCVLVACEEGYYDLDQNPSNGCEYQCTPRGPEVCNGLDDDCNGLTDEGLVCSCPEGMANVAGQFCIDLYEASRPDATETSEGVLDATAMSRPGVMPWRNISFQDAEAACQRAGKHLCSPAQWEMACRGPQDRTYSYGDTYDPTTCNGIDAFCSCGPGSACENESPCPFPHCYGQCGAFFHVVPTGSFPDCTNGYGVFDMNGNVWERVSDGHVRGGAFNCLDSETLHQCSYVPSWTPDHTQSNFGFRCCCTNCPE